MNVRIVGLSHRLGSTVIDAESIENHFKREPGTIANLSGVSRLHRISESEDLVTMAKDACLDAIKNASVELSQVTGIFSSCNPTTDFLIPTLAPLVAAKLGISHVQACNIGMGCAGGVQALQAAYNQSMVDSLRGVTSYYLVVAGDHISRMLDKESWKTAILFSDGISATLITNDPKSTAGFIIEHIASETYAGESVDVINLPNALAQKGEYNRTEIVLHMRGRGVFEFGIRIAPRLLVLSGLESFKDCYIIPHQANIRMLNELLPTMDIRADQLYTDGITKIGNISGAACFLGLEDMVKRNLDNNCERVLLCAFGAELQVAVAVLKRG